MLNFDTSWVKKAFYLQKNLLNDLGMFVTYFNINGCILFHHIVFKTSKSCFLLWILCHFRIKITFFPILLYTTQKEIDKQYLFALHFSHLLLDLRCFKGWLTFIFCLGCTSNEFLLLKWCTSFSQIRYNCPKNWWFLIKMGRNRPNFRF